MASTNKTTNYELSQYIGTDKPTYLGDYNSDMSKIDNAIHGVAQNVGTESARIGVIETNQGTMANLQTTDKSSLVNSINEVNSNTNTNATNIGTLSNLETLNKTTLVNAINEVFKKFNFTDFETIDSNNITISGTAGGSLQLYGTFIKLAYNSDKSLFKIYGRIGIGSVSNQSDTNWKITFPTQLRPTEEFTIESACFHLQQASAYLSSQQYPVAGMAVDKITIKTNGNIEITGNNEGFGRNAWFYIPPCLYFNSNFND